MHVLCDSLGDGFPTYPQFVVMLRDYEHPIVNAPVIGKVQQKVAVQPTLALHKGLKYDVSLLEYVVGFLMGLLLLWAINL